MKRSALLAYALLAPLTLAGAAARPLTFDDMRHVATYSNVAIAPDARRIAAVLRRGDYDKNRFDTTLVLVDARSGSVRALTPGRKKVSDPVWSPSGDRLAFLAPAGEADKQKTQVFVLPTDGGEAKAITASQRDVTAFAWSPDGRRIAYVTQDESPDKKAIEAHDDAFQVTWQPWTARSADVPSHLWLTGSNGGKARRLTFGTWSVVDPIAFGNGGRTIAFTQAPDGSFDAMRRGRVAVLDLATRTVRGVGPVGSSGAAFSRDGRTLTYHQPNAIAPVVDDAVVASADGRRSSALTHFGRAVRDIASDGKSLFVSAPDGTLTRLYRIRRNGGATALPLGPLQPYDFSIARDGTIAVAAANPSDPSELYVLRPPSESPRRLTGTNTWLASRTLGKTATLAWRSVDGVPLDEVVTLPPGYRPTQTYPLVLEVHGGPTSSSPATFSELPQLMAQRGWIVLQPNYRGSDNHGPRAVATSLGRPASLAGSDILAGIALAQRRYSVDRARIGVSGWSAGGWMTSWLITHDGRWRAAVDGAAVDDNVAVVTLSDVDSYMPQLLRGDPWRDSGAMDRALAESPLTYADKVKTPTLIVTDAGDQRVPTPVSYEFYHAIRATGTPVELLVYPVNGHFPSDPLHAEDVYRRWIDWFRSHF